MQCWNFRKSQILKFMNTRIWKPRDYMVRWCLALVSTIRHTRQLILTCLQGYNIIVTSNERHGVSNHQQQFDYLFNSWFRLKTNKTSKLHNTGNPLAFGGFPWKRFSNTETVPMPWCRHVILHSTNRSTCHKHDIPSYWLKVITWSDTFRAQFGTYRTPVHCLYELRPFPCSLCIPSGHTTQ